MRVQGRVDEADGALARRDALLVDAVQDGGEDGRRGRRAADQHRGAVQHDDHVVAHGGEVCGWESLLATGRPAAYLSQAKDGIEGGEEGGSGGGRKGEEDIPG